jgi:starch-binding outer membrane protein, SusD/RagB family
MRKIYMILVASTLLLFTGCDKYLYKEPIGLLTPDQIDTSPTESTVEYSVFTSYQLLSSTLNIIGQWGWDDGTVLRNDFILSDIASDDMQKKWNPDGDQAWMDEIDNFNFTSDNGGFNGQWAYDYDGISRSNLAISYLTDDALMGKLTMDSNLKNRLLGEVYFLRAFYYFDLVNNFGDVPLLLKPLESFSEAYDVAVRTPKDQVMDQVRADLAQAVTLLPNSKYSDDTQPWRASKGAAIAMQAKVELYTQNWQKVLDYISQLDNLGFYSLDANYFDNFQVEKEFTDNEVIFAYDHESNAVPANGNGLCALLGWGFVAPEQNFIDEFEPNDPRLLYTVDVDNQAVYKILGETNTDYKGNDDSPSNKIYIRYADVMLWKAEADINLGNYSEAIGLINQVRARARNSVAIDGTTPPAGTLPDRDITSTDKAQIMGWLRHERRVELGFESQRFNDLKRWGIAKDVLGALGKNFQDNNYLYPIPQREIDKAGGSITQNPGY